MALTDKKQEALRLLSAGHTIPKAADKVGVGRATLWKWTKEPEFSAELTVYRNKEAAGAQMALSHAVYEAVEVLRQIMADEDSSNKEKHFNATHSHVGSFVQVPYLLLHDADGFTDVLDIRL